MTLREDIIDYLGLTGEDYYWVGAIPEEDESSSDYNVYTSREFDDFVREMVYDYLTEGVPHQFKKLIEAALALYEEEEDIQDVYYEIMEDYLDYRWKTYIISSDEVTHTVIAVGNG